jgi:hypothetical protein
MVRRFATGVNAADRPKIELRLPSLRPVDEPGLKRVLDKAARGCKTMLTPEQ